jgi:hypothetical protein
VSVAHVVSMNFLWGLRTRLLACLSSSVLILAACYNLPGTPTPQPAEFELQAPIQDVWNALLEYHTVEVGWEIGSMIRESWTFRSRWAFGRFPDGSTEALDCGRYTAPWP